MNDMTPEQFKAIRVWLGLSQSQMKDVFGYCDKSSISVLENGRRPIRGVTKLAIENLVLSKKIADAGIDISPTI